MPLIPKPNYNQIFASQAPEQDKPAVFNNYPEGWGPESRPNNGKPTIKGFNYLQQTSDLKDLWILQNGACLPYDESIEYADGAPVLKDGVIQYKVGAGFKSRDSVTVPTYNNAADGVDPVTGVADGAYFNVRSASGDSYADEYQNVGGVPTPSGKSYPSSQALNEVEQKQDEQEKEIASIAVKFLLADDIGLTKWTDFKKPPYTTQEYEQAYNNGVRLTAAIKAAHDAGYGEVVLERGNYPFLYTNENGKTFTNNRFGAVKVRDVSYMTVNGNGSTAFAIFDSNNRNPYDNATAQAPWQLHGAIFDTENVREVTFSNFKVRGDQYMRSWVAGENTTEQTYGFFLRDNSIGVEFYHVKFTGFRGDGIGGQGRGKQLFNLSMWYSGGVSTTGVVQAEAGAYNTGMLTLDRSQVVNDCIQLMSTTIRSGAFRNPALRIFFYKTDGTFISSEYIRQCDFVYLPKDCTKVIIVAYGDERTDATVNYGNYILLNTGTSDKVYAQWCEFYENHRGGASNLSGNSVFEDCDFHDIGYSKLGFPNYGDPTRFGIDFENVYVHSLIATRCNFRNIEQGALGGVRDFITRECRFENIRAAGTVAYACAKAMFDQNTYVNVGNAFRYQNSGTYLPKTLVASNNILIDSAVDLDISLYPNVEFHIHDNKMRGGTMFRAIGNGDNLYVNDNVFKDVVETANLLPNIEIRGAVQASGNVVKVTSASTKYNYFGFDSNIDGQNTFFDKRPNTTRINEPAIENEVIKFGDLDIKCDAAKIYQFRLTDKSKGWAAHVDRIRIKNAKYSKVQLQFYVLDGQNAYNSNIKLNRVVLSDDAYISLWKRETGSYSASNSTIVVQDATFDVTNSTRIFYNMYALLGACSITFINCTFISDTPKSIAFIQGQTANVTAIATDCKFINVTNTDSILQINGTAKTTFDPPSIESGATEVTTVTLSGATVGSLAQASFSQYNADIEMSAVVSAPNTVTVRFKNTSAAPVDLPSGTLTVKLV